MTWRFRKRLTIFPGVRQNIGKRGFNSASIGHVLVDPKGLIVNAPITGTGLSWRQRLLWWRR